MSNKKHGKGFNMLTIEEISDLLGEDSELPNFNNPKVKKEHITVPTAAVVNGPIL
jgi:hypothetical protein